MSDTTSQTPRPAAAPSRVLTSNRWLSNVVTERDYYRSRPTRVDISVWALLFSVVAPVGITLGIIGIIKGLSGNKNKLTVLWSSLAITISILLPVILWVVSSNGSSLRVGQTVETAGGISVSSPSGSVLLDDGYDLLMSTEDGSGTYGVYQVFPTGQSWGIDDINNSLQDDTSDRHAYWLYQLFTAYGIEFGEVQSAVMRGDVIELVGTGFESSVVVSVHQSGDVLLVQYLTGPTAETVAVYLALDHLLGSFDTDSSVSDWRELSASLQYQPTDSYSEFEVFD